MHAFRQLSKRLAGPRLGVILALATAVGAATLVATPVAPATASGSPLQASSKARSGNVPFLSATTSKSFSSAVSSLKTAVSSAGMMVLGQLNQAGALSVTGLHLKGAEKFFVGNPTVGKKLFAMDPAIGMEIPLGIYLWVDHMGTTEIGYFAPPAIFKAVAPKLAGQGPMFAGIAAKVADGAA